MVQSGKMRLVEKVPGEHGRVCVFETTVGERFSMVKPAIGKEQELALIDVLREILEDWEPEPLPDPWPGWYARR
jgi:hypothetical protein